MSYENLWAPWRMAYLRELARKAEALGEVEAGAGPFLSEYFKTPQQDEKHHVVYRNEHGMILRANGNILVLAPALIITEEQIDWVVDQIDHALDAAVKHFDL